MADFLDEKRKEIDARLKELRPLVDEYNGWRRLRPHSPEWAVRQRAGRRRRAAARLHGRRRGAGAGAADAPGARASEPCRPRSW